MQQQTAAAAAAFTIAEHWHLLLLAVLVGRWLATCTSSSPSTSSSSSSSVGWCSRCLGERPGCVDPGVAGRLALSGGLHPVSPAQPSPAQRRRKASCRATLATAVCLPLPLPLPLQTEDIKAAFKAPLGMIWGIVSCLFITPCVSGALSTPVPINQCMNGPLCALPT